MYEAAAVLPLLMCIEDNNKHTEHNSFQNLYD